MEKTLVVANFKENFTVAEAEQWVGELNKELLSEGQPAFGRRIMNEGEKAGVVICPPFVLIPTLYSSFSILHSPLSLGAQDVSKFEEGQYTGEVSAKMLKDFVEFVIVGHSERRKFFGETDEDVSRKIEQCLKYGLTPIVCVSTIQELSSLPSGLSSSHRPIIVYEPVEHISTGGEFHPDDPRHANLIAQKIKAEVGQDVRVLYGGSVTAENVKWFVNQPDIDGVLVGQASLDAKEFAEIVKLSNC